MPQDRNTPVDPSDLESDLKALATNSKNLNRLTDDLSNYIETIESTINSFNPGVKVSVIAESGSDEYGVWSHYLRLLYDKIDGKWGLVIDEYDENDDPDSKPVNQKIWVFKDAPRALRLRVVSHIPAVIKALVKESEKMAKATEVSVARAKEISSSLSKLSPSKQGGK